MAEEESTEGSVVRTLLRAADLVDSGWTQGHWAVNSEGGATQACAADAAAWCLDGAMLKAAFEKKGWTTETDKLLGECVHRVKTKLGVGGDEDGQITWNDAAGRTRGEVSRALREAAGAPA